MISGRFIFGIFSFCLLWIWMFSGHSKSKRSITVKSSTYEITNSLSTYLVSELPEKNEQWFPLSKSVEQFAGVSFEVIPATKTGEIIVALFSDQKTGADFLIFKIQWNKEMITVNYKMRSKNSEARSLEATFKNKFTCKFQLIQVCSNNKCSWHYLNYQSTAQLKFSSFLISMSTNNAALIRNFKIQKFLANPNTIKYFPLNGSNNILENFPTPKSLEITFNLYHLISSSHHFLCTFPSSNKSAAIEEIRIVWKQFPKIIELQFGVQSNMTKLSIPYPNNFNSLLTVHLYVDNFKNRVIMEVNEQNITTFVSADKFQKINQIQKVYEVPYVSFSINSEQGFLNDPSYPYSRQPNSQKFFFVELPKPAYMIAFREINALKFTAIIRSFANGYDINVTRFGCEPWLCEISFTLITFNNQTITVNHDLAISKPEFEIILGKDAITLFTSDGKSGYIEPGIPPEWFVNLTISSNAMNVLVHTLALAK